ncbi:MAG: 50S ribosomal protein L25/general stress protein Ctc [Rhodospirillaceae bacterium]|nr:50S ribosomal protein L25/general stress protein Ctc [Rhodospirillaceae bacterium]|tara:strand:+ start:335 stop:1012 length:678 start_codon:yes stop_codon:yes gene_type:complete
MADITLMPATKREKIGKGASRSARREGHIPAVIYGEKKPNLSITVEAKELVRQLNTGSFFTTLFSVEIDGESNQVLPRDVQMHPVTDAPEHVDFLRVGANTVVTVDVPVEFQNEENCPGLRVGGVLNVVRYTVEVSCRPDQIPNSIVVDLAEAELGDSLHISAVELPEGVTPTITDRDFTIATIAAPTAVQDEEDELAEGEEGDEFEGEEGTATETQGGDEDTEE